MNKVQLSRDEWLILSIVALTGPVEILSLAANELPRSGNG